MPFSMTSTLRPSCSSEWFTARGSTTSETHTFWMMKWLGGIPGPWQGVFMASWVRRAPPYQRISNEPAPKQDKGGGNNRRTGDIGVVL